MRGAADELGINHSVVSRHVANLEAWIGHRLVKAGPRGVVLTREGELYAQRIGTALALMRAATVEIMPQHEVVSLRIWCAAGLAIHWLAPRLGAIQELLPRAEITLRPFETAVTLDDKSTDVLIGFGNLEQMPAHSTLLATPRMIPVASPDWLKLHPEIETVEDLTSLPLIHEQTKHFWSDWFDRADIRMNAPLRGPLLWDAGLGVDAAAAGQGVALVSETVAAPLISEGKLVEMFKTDITLGSYYVVASAQEAQSPTLRRLKGWLLQEMGSSEIYEFT